MAFSELPLQLTRTRGLAWTPPRQKAVIDGNQMLR